MKFTRELSNLLSILWRVFSTSISSLLPHYAYLVRRAERISPNFFDFFIWSWFSLKLYFSLIGDLTATDFPEIFTSFYTPGPTDFQYNQNSFRSRNSC